MIATNLRYLTVKDSMSVAEAYWINMQNGFITEVVVDENDKFLGVIGQAEFKNNRYLDPNEKIISIYNKKSTVINCCGGVDPYSVARDLFLKNDMEYIPAVTETGDLVDYFSRKRAFYYDYFKRGILSRMHYATSIMAAARLAKQLGEEGISVIEFGVAAGTGLLNAQFHAKEIERITGIKIRLYGFDTGEGLPKMDHGNSVDNMEFLYSEGDYKMNKTLLVDKIEGITKLVIGDINDTLPTFIEDEKPYPIGAVFVDTDTYDAAKCILDWMDGYAEGGIFLPRVFMYFDDICPALGNVGEDKAISEFNKRNMGKMNIAPEGLFLELNKWMYNCDNEWMFNVVERYQKYRMKICHRFLDERYNTKFEIKEINDIENICVTI